LPSIVTALATVPLGWLFGMPRADLRLVTMFVTVLMTQFSISAMNEWADRGRDAASHRYRPVALGLISPGVALGLAFVFALAALPGAIAFGPLSLAIVGLAVTVGWTYDLVLKPTPLSFLPFVFAFPLLPLWVGIIAGRPLNTLLFLFLAGAPLALAIHLADAIPDREVDGEVGLKTLAVTLGKPAAEAVAVAAYLGGAAVTIGALWKSQRESIPVSSLLLNSFVLASIAYGYLVISLSRSSPVSLRRRQQLAKWLLVLTSVVVGGLLALFVAHG
jgi:4-hydroxybenzoate polyprenyltransferase